MGNMKISAVILTKNEESTIKECIASVRWCDEVLVIDDDSTDATREVARKFGAIVYQQGLNNNFALQRNFGLKMAHGEWVLFLDSDERISTSLTFEIQGKIISTLDTYTGYMIKRQDSMWGKVLKHGETGNIALTRLAKRDAGEWKGRVHEKWDIKGSIGRLDNPIIHFPHLTITEFLKEINFYTDLRASELHEKKVKVSWWHILAYPKAKFFVNFILKQGFRDGIPGLMLAVFMSLHSFMVRGKLWLLYHSE